MHSISICIPLYNGQRYIAQAIESVLNQTCGDFQLVVVDDCSGDSGPDIVKGFKDDRLVFYRNEKRLGLVENWNKCVSYASGEYICILHQDDYYLPNMLEQERALLANNAGVGIVFSQHYFIDAYDARMGVWKFTDSPGIWEGREIAKQHVIYNFAGMVTVMVKKDCYDSVGLYDKDFLLCPDWDMWLRIELAGYRVGYLAEPLACYRVHDESVTSQLMARGLINEERQRFLRKAFSRMKLGHLLGSLEFVALKKKAFRPIADEELASVWQAVREGSCNKALLHLKTYIKILIALEASTRVIIGYESMLHFLKQRLHVIRLKR